MSDVGEKSDGKTAAVRMAITDVVVVVVDGTRKYRVTTKTIAPKTENCQ